MLILSTLLSLTIICNATLIEDQLIDIPAEEEIMPMMARSCQFNSLNLLKSTEIGKYTVTMDLELGGAGYNIHIKVNGKTYYYDMQNECWPSSVPNKVANSSAVAKALEHGYERIAAGWK